jgi:hypothetical protein
MMSNTMRELKIDEVESVSGGVLGALPSSPSLPSGLFANGYYTTDTGNGWGFVNSY